MALKNVCSVEEWLSTPPAESCSSADLSTTAWVVHVLHFYIGVGLSYIPTLLLLATCVVVLDVWRGNIRRLFVLLSVAYFLFLLSTLSEVLMPQAFSCCSDFHYLELSERAGTIVPNLTWMITGGIEWPKQIWNTPRYSALPKFYLYFTLLFCVEASIEVSVIFYLHEGHLPPVIRAIASALLLFCVLRFGFGKLEGTITRRIFHPLADDISTPFYSTCLLIHAGLCLPCALFIKWELVHLIALQMLGGLVGHAFCVLYSHWNIVVDERGTTILAITSKSADVVKNYDLRFQRYFFSILFYLFDMELGVAAQQRVPIISRRVQIYCQEIPSLTDLPESCRLLIQTTLLSFPDRAFFTRLKAVENVHFHIKLKNGKWWKDCLEEKASKPEYTDLVAEGQRYFSVMAAAWVREKEKSLLTRLPVGILTSALGFL